MSEENKEGGDIATDAPTTPAPDTAAGKFSTKFVLTNILHV